MTKNNFGTFFMEHRLLSGFKTKTDLAKASEVSKTTISRIEKEQQRPSVETIKTLSKFLTSTSLDEMMVVCGYWDEEDLLDTNFDKEKTPDSIEQKFVKQNINLTDEQLLEKYDFSMNGKKLSDEQAKAILSIIKSAHQLSE